MRLQLLQKLSSTVTLMLAAFVLLAGTVEAQDVKKKADSDKSERRSIVIKRSADGDSKRSGVESVKIEIKDGRTFVNGTEVPEGEDIADYLPDGTDASFLDSRDGARAYFFSNDDEDGERMAKRWVTGDDEDVTVWIDDEDMEFGSGHIFKKDGNVIVGRAPRHGGTFSFSGDDNLYELREGLAELGNNVGSNAFSFFTGSSSPTSREIMKMEMEARKLARKLASAEGSEETKLSAELDDLLEKIFDEKTRLRVERLDELRVELNEEEEALASRKRKRAQIIADRKAELTGSKKNEW